MDEMLVLCHSPLAYGDPALCGEARLPEGATAKICEAASNSDPEEEELELELQRVIDQNDGVNNLEELVAACGSAFRVLHGDPRYHERNSVV